MWFPRARTLSSPTLVPLPGDERRPDDAESVFVASVDHSRPELHSVQDVASRLGVHPETIRRLIHSGGLDAVRVGRVLRVHGAAVERYLARHRVKPLAPLAGDGSRQAQPGSAAA